MRKIRFPLTVLVFAIACTSSAPSATTPTATFPGTITTPSVSTTGSPSPTTTLADGSALPSGCEGSARASETVAFVAGERAWALDPATQRLDCLFPTTDPGPFAWGPQGDRVLLGGFQVLGLNRDSPDLPAIGARPASFDWGHPIGLAVVYAGATGQP